MKHLLALLILVSSFSVLATCKEELEEGDKVDQTASSALSSARELDAPFIDMESCERFQQAAGYAFLGAEYLLASQVFYQELSDKGTCDEDEKLSAKLVARKALVEKLLIESQMLQYSYQVKLSAHNCQAFLSF